MNRLELGKWNCICDRCGFEFKSDELKKEWTNLMVCSSCWEPRHPQDLLRPRVERGDIPWSRPEPVEIEVSPFLQTESTYLPLDILTELGQYLNEE